MARSSAASLPSRHSNKKSLRTAQLERDERSQRIHATSPSSTNPGFRLDPVSAARIKQALNISVPPRAAARIRGYAREYILWCRNQGYARKDILPAPQDLLCAYASSFMGRLAASTVKAKLRALKKLHLWKGLRWAGGDKLDAVVEAVGRKAPASSRKEKRPPVTLEMLLMLATGLCIYTSALDACIFMVACVAFFCQIRLGELLNSKRDPISFDPEINPTGRHLKPPSTKLGSRILHIPFSKTRLEKGDDVVVARQQGPTDPIAAIDNHFSLNRISPDVPLASYVEYPDGMDFPPVRYCLTKEVFLRRCNEIWKRQDIQRFTGHSFRIGGTTFFLISGINPEVVKAFGRWRSSAFLAYWRCLDALAVLHIEMIANLKGFVIPKA
ncbi:hypothetical protein C8J56DRAFT_981098 [Mycena floridula]|nr:hypothetical protein C8J56DRAFT_981098 [Mycena floridula]